MALRAFVVGTAHVEGLVRNPAERPTPGLELFQPFELGHFGRFGDVGKQRVVRCAAKAVEFRVGQVGNEPKAFLVPERIAFGKGPRVAQWAHAVGPSKKAFRRFAAVARAAAAGKQDQSTDDRKDVLGNEHGSGA